MELTREIIRHRTLMNMILVGIALAISCTILLINTRKKDNAKIKLAVEAFLLIYVVSIFIVPRVYSNKVDIRLDKLSIPYDNDIDLDNLPKNIIIDGTLENVIYDKDLKFINKEVSIKEILNKNTNIFKIERCESKSMKTFVVKEIVLKYKL